jgi:hypothetical protein
MSDALDVDTGTLIYDIERLKQLVPDRTTAPTVVAISGTTARCAALDPGIYELRPTTNIAYLVGGSSVEAVAATDFPLGAYLSDYVYISSSNNQIAAIQQAAAGYLMITKMVAGNRL